MNGTPYSRQATGIGLQDTLSELSKVNAGLDVDRGADDGALLDDTAQEDQQEDEDVLGLDDEETEDEPEI